MDGDPITTTLHISQLFPLDISFKDDKTFILHRGYFFIGEIFENSYYMARVKIEMTTTPLRLFTLLLLPFHLEV